MIIIRNCRFEIEYKSSDIERVVRKRLWGVKSFSWRIDKRSLDARKKDDIHYVISIAVSLSDNDGMMRYDSDRLREDNTGSEIYNCERALVRKLRDKNIIFEERKAYIFPYKASQSEDLAMRPVIVGAGPAGYFAAIYLAEAGFRPIVIERGRCVEERFRDVEDFWETGRLNTESNISFGEGGAGTFSDGKLYTGNKNKGGYFSEVLRTFHRFGAKEEILYDARPHIGTDVLRDILKNMREYIISCGGEIRFSTRLDEISRDDKKLYRLKLSSTNGDGEAGELLTNVLILATGHSARDTVGMLYDKGFRMSKKPYAIGLRIEHPRDMIDESMYGSKYEGRLPAADYKLTYHASNGRAVFSFCMCPGGYVVNASSDKNSMVVNGMSYSGRNGLNSNSAIVVGITPDDVPGDSPEDAIAFQQGLEKSFYDAGDGKVPVQTLGDFLEGRRSDELGNVIPQIKGRYVLSELSYILPEYVTEALRESFPHFGRTIRGFDRHDAVLSGIESRTSSPVRIERDEKLFAEGFEGIIPAGEGAGYAGGITSAAADGIRAAEAAAGYIVT